MQWCKAIITCSVALTLLTMAGCGKKGDATDSQAAISGADGVKNVGGSSGGPSTRQDPLHPLVVVETSLGNVTVRLDKEKAQLTVDNFLSYVESRHYDQTIFHQVFKGQGILGGGYAADANQAEKPTRTPVRNEARLGRKNLRGTIAMVRSIDSPDSATCQFLLNVADNEILDHRDDSPEGYGYCVFGEVIVGMEVVDKIAEAPVNDTSRFERTPVQTVLIRSIRRM